MSAGKEEEPFVIFQSSTVCLVKIELLTFILKPKAKPQGEGKYHINKFILKIINSANADFQLAYVELAVYDR